MAVDPALAKVKSKIEDGLAAIGNADGQLDNLLKRVPLAKKEVEKLIAANKKLANGEMTVKQFIELRNACTNIRAASNYGKTLNAYYTQFDGKVGDLK